MARRSDLTRLERLDHVIQLFRSGAARTTRELAHTLGVSPRSVTRDIALLRQRGAPLAASSGRGGGLRLEKAWPLTGATLDHREAINILIALALLERMEGPVDALELRAIRTKLAAAFAPDQQERIRSLRRRVLVGANSSDAVRQTIRPLKPETSRLYHAFLEQRLVEVRYRDLLGRRSHRTIEPHYVLVAWPAYYVLAWDHARNDVRSFRLDRVESVRAHAQAFRLRPETLFEGAIAEIGAPV